MLKAIFYARFHPERGPSVVHQFPANSIVPAAGKEGLLVQFSDISAYIIPPYELCNQPLSICSNGYRVLGYPVSLEDDKYERNRFTFNVCFVLDETEDARGWQLIAKKTAKFFQAVEEEDGLLQVEEQLPGLKWAGEETYPAQDIGVVYKLLHTIVEDLNAYQETCIRVDDVHVLNLRLTVSRPAPPKVRAWDVPLLIRSLPEPEEWSRDLTLQRIIEHIDGVKHVQRIADLADVEAKLVERAVRELVYHDRAMLLDIFHFAAVYAPTADLASFVKDAEMVEECCQYVATDPSKKISEDTIIDLYTSFNPGLSVAEVVAMNQAYFTNVDIRRVVTFAVIKGFLRRIHKYPLLVSPGLSNTLGTTDSSPTKSKPKSNEDAVKEFDRAWKKAALSSGWATPPTELPTPSESVSKSARSADEARSEDDEKLAGYLDGKHCLDQVCVEMRMSERKVLERIKSGRFGEVVVLSR